VDVQHLRAKKFGEVQLKGSRLVAATFEKQKQAS
jgi:hypothetical protein